MRAVDLDRVREAREQRQHARALAREMVGVVHHEVEAPRAAREQEARRGARCARVVQPQRRAVGIEDAQLAAGLLEQAVDRGLEAVAGVEALVDRRVSSIVFSRIR